jgi:Ca-activated chloride channel family protein
VVALAVLLAACAHDPAPRRNATRLANPGACVPVDVAVAPVDLPAVQQFADTFNGSSAARLASGKCAFVRLTPVGSGDAARHLLDGWPDPFQDGPAPAAWVPEATVWTALVNQRHAAVSVDATGPSLARNRVVTAAPASGAANSTLVGVGNPQLSTTGLLARVNREPPFDESSVVYYAGSDAVYLENWHRDPDFVSSVVTDDRTLAAYNAGKPFGPIVRTHSISDTRAVPAPLGVPGTPLVATNGSSGPAQINHPLVAVHASWVTAAANAGAAAFIRFVGGQRPAAIAEHRDVAGTLDAWQVHRKPGRVLLVVDTSASMGDRADPNDSSSPTKLSVLQRALHQWLPLLGARDEVGLRAFSTRWHDVVPIGAYASNHETLMRAIDDLRPAGSSALYSAAQDAFAAVPPDPSHITGVVLITDSYNEVEHGVSRETVLGGLHGPSRLFTVSYSRQADIETLQMFSVATAAKMFDATDYRDLSPAVRDALASF